MRASNEEASQGARLLDKSTGADIEGLQRLLRDEGTREVLAKATRIMTECQTVYLVGQLSVLSGDLLPAYALSEMSVPNVLVNGVGGTFCRRSTVGARRRGVAS